MMVLFSFLDFVASKIWKYIPSLFCSTLSLSLFFCFSYSISLAIAWKDCGWIWKPVPDVTRSRTVHFRGRGATPQDPIDRNYSLRISSPSFLYFGALLIKFNIVFNLITNSHARNIYFNKKRVIIIISLRLLKGVFKLLLIISICQKYISFFEYHSIKKLKKRHSRIFAASEIFVRNFWNIKNSEILLKYKNALL